MIVFRRNDFPNLMVYCNERCAKVLVCGAPCNYFDGDTEVIGRRESTEEIVVEATVNNSNDDNLLVVPVINQNQERREKIVQLISEDYQVDDDNQPAPENIPNVHISISSQEGMHWFPWGSRAVCK